MSVIRVWLTLSSAHTGTRVPDGGVEANLKVPALPAALGQQSEQRSGTIFEICARAFKGFNLVASVSAQFLVDPVRAPCLVLVYAELNCLDGCVG